MKEREIELIEDLEVLEALRHMKEADVFTHWTDRDLDYTEDNAVEVKA